MDVGLQGSCLWSHVMISLHAMIMYVYRMSLVDGGCLVYVSAFPIVAAVAMKNYVAP